MFKYYLKELLNNEELLKKVITKKFYLCDGGAGFSTLDFENNTMQSNHITTFRQLYEIGGKKIFDEIIKEGKTCLMDNNANNNAVEINGYYLRKGVSDEQTFSSILNAVKHIGDVDELFDIDDIYVEYEDRIEEILSDISPADMEYMEKLDRIHRGEE